MVCTNFWYIFWSAGGGHGAAGYHARKAVLASLQVWFVLRLLGQDELALTGFAQDVALAAMLDHDLTLAVEQLVAMQCGKCSGSGMVGVLFMGCDNIDNDSLYQYVGMYLKARLPISGPLADDRIP